MKKLKSLPGRLRQLAVSMIWRGGRTKILNVISAERKCFAYFPARNAHVR